MRNSEYHYFQFPLCLLQKVHKNAYDGFDMIMDYGLMDFANKLQDHPPNDGILNEWQIESWEETDPLDIAAKILGVKLGSKNSTKNRHKIACDFIAEKTALWGAYPKPGIKTDFIFDARDRNNPSETYLMAALIGVKSIIGQKKFAATHKCVIACRMVGCKRNEELRQTLKDDPVLANVYNKYINRYHIDRIIKELINRGFLRSKIAYGRQIFLSDELDYKELQKEIVAMKQSKQHNQKEKESRMAISQILHGKR